MMNDKKRVISQSEMQKELVRYILDILYDTHENISDHQSWVHQPDEWLAIIASFLELALQSGLCDMDTIDEYNRVREGDVDDWS